MLRDRVGNRSWTTALACLVLLATPATSSSTAKEKKTEGEVERRHIQILKPEIALEPVAENPAAQEIGGVRIELTRIPFTVRPMFFVTVQERTTKWESITGIRVGTAAPVWVGGFPFYDIKPENLQFKVRITNHLGRVLRLEGVALQFMKDGEAVYTDSTANDLNKVIILPEKSWEGVLAGPTFEAFGLKAFDMRTLKSGLLDAPQLAAEGVLLVGLYDVITELNEASNATKRSNFEWVFGYTARAVPEDAEAIRWKTRLTPEVAAKIIGDHPAEEFAGNLPGK